jgi:hypothetical protein
MDLTAQSLSGTAGGPPAMSAQREQIGPVLALGQTIAPWDAYGGRDARGPREELSGRAKVTNRTQVRFTTISAGRPERLR